MGLVFKIFSVASLLRSFNDGAKGVAQATKTSAFKSMCFALVFAIGFVGLAMVIISDFQFLDATQISILRNVFLFVLIVPVCGFVISKIFIDKKVAIRDYLIKKLRTPELAGKPSKQSIPKDKVSLSNTYPTDFRPPRNTPDA